MGKFPNKATQFKTGDRQVEIARKGGKTVTEKQRRAQKLVAIKRAIKKGWIDKTNSMWLVDRLSNIKFMEYEMLSYLDSIKGQKSITPIQWFNAYNTLYKNLRENKKIDGNSPGNVKVNIIMPEGYKDSKEKN